jgi:hypothetical protein
MNRYQIVIINIVSFMRNVFGEGVYRGHSQHREDLTPNRETHSNPIAIDKSYAFRFVLLTLILLQMAIPMPSYGASYSVDHLRLYLHSRVLNYEEFKCMDRILWMESRYNYKAVNGSHTGIGQMRSKYYQSKDPFTQIDLTLKYSYKRYSTLCKALSFHLKHGYY